MSRFLVGLAARAAGVVPAVSPDVPPTLPRFAARRVHAAVDGIAVQCGRAWPGAGDESGRAGAEIADVDVDEAVVLAGDGPLRKQLSKLVSDQGLADTVSLLGHRPDVGDLLAAADLIVLPSLWEGLSISLLEAMAAGTPVVTTTIGSNREVTNDGETAGPH